ncbi:MAG: hypothetical protein V3U15_05995 [Nitrospinota bacterium]
MRKKLISKNSGDITCKCPINSWDLKEDIHQYEITVPMKKITPLIRKRAVCDPFFTIPPLPGNFP